MYTSLGVITKGTIIEVNISELGMVTQGGKVVWAKFAQVSDWNLWSLIFTSLGDEQSRERRMHKLGSPDLS